MSVAEFTADLDGADALFLMKTGDDERKATVHFYPIIVAKLQQSIGLKENNVWQCIQRLRVIMAVSETMIALGDIHLVVRAIVVHRDSQSIVRAGLSLLEHLSVETIKSLNPTIQKITTDSMGNFIDDANVQYSGFVILGKLLASDRDTVVSHIDDDLIRLIANALCAHERCAYVQQVGISLIGRLATDRNNRVLLMKKRLGVEDGIHRAMVLHVYCENVAERALATLTNLSCDNVYNKAHLVRDGFLPLIVQVMEGNQQVVRVQHTGLKALANLAMYSVNKALMMQLDTASFVMRVMDDHKTDEGITETGNVVLTRLRRRPVVVVL